MSRRTYVRKAERMMRRARSYERAMRPLEDEYNGTYESYAGELRYWQHEIDRRKAVVGWR